MLDQKLVDELLKQCDYSLSAGPLMTAIQELPTTDDRKELASLPIFDLSPFLIPDMIYRLKKGMNYFIYIHGYRAFFKSTTAIWWAWMCSILSGFELPNKQKDFIVDNNMELVSLIRKNKPKFFTAIKDEVDRKSFGAGTQAVEETLENQINRIRGRQYNIIYCTPEEYYFPVDFTFRTWRFRRKPKDEAITRMLVEHEGETVGHINFPLPPQSILQRYHKGVKRGFLKRTQTLHDPIIATYEDILNILLNDPDFPARAKVRGIFNIAQRMRYIGKKWGFLTEGLKKELERETFMMGH